MENLIGIGIMLLSLVVGIVWGTYDAKPIVKGLIILHTVDSDTDSSRPD